MKRLLININERGKISYVPSKIKFGRREPVTIQMVQPPLVQEPTNMVNIIITHNRLIPCATPTDFLPRVNTGLKDKLDYIQKELIKVQEQRRCEEFSTFYYMSRLPEEEMGPYMQLSKELYYDTDISLGESAIPYHQQQRDLGSLNDRHPSNMHPHDTRKVVVVDESQPKRKMTYSRWSE
jgi:hypothetical protein